MAEAMPCVLVVDDDQDMRKMACDYLTMQGCLVSQAVDGAKTLTQIAADPPDVILLDIGLPDVPDTDLFAAIQVQCPNTAVIFVTALNKAEQAAEMMKQGAFHYLVKPIQMSRLWATVREAWAERQGGEGCGGAALIDPARAASAGSAGRGQDGWRDCRGVGRQRADDQQPMSAVSWTRSGRKAGCRRYWPGNAV